MSGRTRERLSRLFHRHDDTSSTPKTPPPASPSSPSSRSPQQHVGERSSGAQMSPRDSKRHGRQISVDQANMALSNGGQAGAQAAATKAMRPDQDMTLPTLPQHTDLSSEFGNLTMSDRSWEAAEGTRPYSEDVATRNLGNYGARASQDANASARQSVYDNAPTRGSPEQRSKSHRKSVGNAQPLIPDRDPRSEDVATRNIAHSDMGRRDVPQSSRLEERSPLVAVPQAQSPQTAQRDFADGHSLSRKQDMNDLRRSQDMTRSNISSLPSRDARKGLNNDDRHVGASSLDKALPTDHSNNRGLESEAAVKQDFGVESELGRERGYLVKDSEKPVALSGILDLRNTEDTTLHERWAPAVTHEVVQQNVHHIREEVITREIHEYHHFHRILPIVDIEVLPARHFTPVEGGYVEIAEEEVPGQAGPNANWVIAETVSRMMPKSSGQLPIRQFTARKFEGKDGDYKEYTTADGIKRTEQWWVHPPTIETGGQVTGQTYPFYFGCPNPADNGLRATLPVGNLVGVSPLLAKQQRERAGRHQQTTTDPAPPAVPPHKVFPADLVDSARAGPKHIR